MNSREFFEILVRDNADMLRVFLNSSVRDSALVDDIFQETLLVAWKSMDRYDKSRPFGRWLRGIAAKLILAQHRKTARLPVCCDADALDILDERFDSLQRQHGDTLDEKLEGLRACVAALPERLRETVLCRYQEELRGPHLAQRLQISLANANKRLQRARIQLLDCLDRKLSYRREDIPVQEGTP